MQNLLEQYNNIVFFTGAGMSAESGVPTYRGRGGIWNEYKWEEYACENRQPSLPASPGAAHRHGDVVRGGQPP